MKNKITCIGEILWDSLPLGLFLGGAPFNVAFHLNKLGHETTLVSRIGEDELGREIMRRLDIYKISSDFIQLDKKHPTGFVSVELDKTGSARYNISNPSAWDFIEVPLLNDYKKNDAVVFGTLAQRSDSNLAVISEVVSSHELRVLDLNLRYPYDNPEVILHSLNIANVLKLNMNELTQLCQVLDITGTVQSKVDKIQDLHSLHVVCITDGGNGAIMKHDNDWVKQNGFPINVVDTVGSGDAFLAGLLSGLLKKDSPEMILHTANLLGAFVSTRIGAIPEYDLQQVLSEYLPI